jgi:hypothetical protein
MLSSKQSVSQVSSSAVGTSRRGYRITDIVAPSQEVDNQVHAAKPAIEQDTVSIPSLNAAGMLGQNGMASCIAVPPVVSSRQALNTDPIDSHIAHYQSYLDTVIEGCTSGLQTSEKDQICATPWNANNPALTKEELQQRVAVLEQKLGWAEADRDFYRTLLFERMVPRR